MAVAATALIPQTLAADPSPPVRAGGAASGGDWNFTFHDLISIVNPLQHFPIVSTLYRKLTGDTIKPLERVAGDTLYGGWIGLASSVANLVFEKETGKDFGDTVLAMIDGDENSGTSAAKSEVADLASSSPLIAPAVPTPLQANSSAGNAGVSAPASSIAEAQIDPYLGQRAIYAYRKSMEASVAPMDLMPAF